MKEKLEDKSKLARQHKISILLNDLELEALNKYCKKYKITNRSKLIREKLFTAVVKKFEDDYPSLFDFENNKP
ncbi:MAG: hypothetical protein CSB01_00545 [Bacteroidia bacterium]|nr:MAG: hypothetical protein CSB01_00545 [Bacteroidia bacterium]